MKKPSLYDNDACLFCGSPYVQLHHVYPGYGRRKVSDQQGCTVMLCQAHHTGPHGVHQDRKLDSWLRKDCQMRWELREYGQQSQEAHDDFRRHFGVSYL